MRTVQLRRYRFAPGELDAFSAWWRERLLPAREACGFTVEFACAVPEEDEFVWALSVDGDAADFARIEADYLSSRARADAFAVPPPQAVQTRINLVNQLPGTTRTKERP